MMGKKFQQQKKTNFSGFFLLFTDFRASLVGDLSSCQTTDQSYEIVLSSLVSPCTSFSVAWLTLRNRAQLPDWPSDIVLSWLVGLLTYGAQVPRQLFEYMHVHLVERFGNVLCCLVGQGAQVPGRPIGMLLSWLVGHLTWCSGTWSALWHGDQSAGWPFNIVLRYLVGL